MDPHWADPVVAGHAESASTATLITGPAEHHRRRALVGQNDVAARSPCVDVDGPPRPETVPEKEERP
ncbi:hypothetical protein GCM10023175_10970 [Pseudonocardia xishanensis]|uniref:Uncharacterized protein n=1 Tax=Pseudonocardia xishanensis TaxID=630995 RepID=A0ABP8RIU6_9PSEU